MQILPKQPSTKGPAEMFTGGRLVRRHRGWSGTLAPAGERRAVLARARTGWHSHAVGQTLHVTEGLGLVQSRGGHVIELRPGQSVYTPPGE